MNKVELANATVIAMDRKEDLSTVDDSIMWGFGLPNFIPVTVTIRQVAKMIRWQAVQFNGELDAEAYNELAVLGRKRFIVTS